jgi:hypothetical protein
MLMSVHRKNIKHATFPSFDYSYDEPCKYSRVEQLDELADKHTWVKEILRVIRNEKADIFLSPDFYQKLANPLPESVMYPGLFIYTGVALRLLRGLPGFSTLQN